MSPEPDASEPEQLGILTEAIGADGPSPLDLTDRSALAALVHGRFAARIRETVTLDFVRSVVASLDLEEQRRARRVPYLHVSRLRFGGIKRIDGVDTPYVYDELFGTGVNVVLIPRNEAGKSSILKTIKFALTGDDGDYDSDVRRWISDIWLTFALDAQPFTIGLSRTDAGLRAALVSGKNLCALDEMTDTEEGVLLFDVTGAEQVRSELQRFFFARLGLSELSWTATDPTVPGGIAERQTSWLTYFQALTIPDASDTYLLCDAQHAIGNQEGLIFSSFLGLSLVQPLNRLQVESSLARRESRLQEQRTEEEISRARQEAAEKEVLLQSVRAELAALDREQRSRQAAVRTSNEAGQLADVVGLVLAKTAELARIVEELNSATDSVLRLRRQERQMREAVSVHLHLTGLEVTLCPNCDASVDDGAIAREREEHRCRLCGKEAVLADQDEVALLTEGAEAVSREIDAQVRERQGLTSMRTVLRGELDRLTERSTLLQQAARTGLDYALPTDEETARRQVLAERIGALQAEITMARNRAQPTPADDTSAQDRGRVVEKVRDVLREEAQLRNEQALQRLSALTTDVARRIGAESITDVTCSPVGQVQMYKHGQKVSFSGIRNEGERLRVKLAFFLAMMRLGTEEGLGRHPGFLQIDQPGSGEMVSENVAALAEVLRALDAEAGIRLQIICYTARAEVAEATDNSRVHGPQAPPYAF